MSLTAKERDQVRSIVREEVIDFLGAWDADADQHVADFLPDHAVPLFAVTVWSDDSYTVEDFA